MRERKTREQRQQQVYETALTVFARFGYKKTTVEDIAEKLDVTKGTLYLYAENKRDLYEKAIHSSLVKWQIHVLEAMVGKEDVVEQFRVMALKAYEYLNRDKDLQAVVSQDPSILIIYPGVDRFTEVNQNSLALIKDILRRGIAQGRFREVNVETTAEFFFSIYNMFIIKTYVEQEGEGRLAQVFADGVDVLLNGLVR